MSGTHQAWRGRRNSADRRAQNSRQGAGALGVYLRRHFVRCGRQIGISDRHGRDCAAEQRAGRAVPKLSEAFEAVKSKFPRDSDTYFFLAGLDSFDSFAVLSLVEESLVGASFLSEVDADSEAPVSFALSLALDFPA